MLLHLPPPFKVDQIELTKARFVQWLLQAIFPHALLEHDLLLPLPLLLLLMMGWRRYKERRIKVGSSAPSSQRTKLNRQRKGEGEGEGENKRRTLQERLSFNSRTCKT